MKIFHPVNFGVKPSKFLLGEVGLFALRDLRTGTVITENTENAEEFYDSEYYNQLDDVSKKVVYDFCEIVEGGFYSLQNLNIMPISWMCNHSCNPNAGFDENNNLSTIKNVVSGEELVYDYAFVIKDPEFSMECKCGSTKCRKIIKGTDWKDPDFFKLNEKYICM